MSIRDDSAAAERGLAEPGDESKVEGVVVGRLVSFTDSGAPQVAFTVPGTSTQRACVARQMVGVSSGDVGRTLALLFEEGDVRRPVIMGLMAVSTGAPSRVRAEPTAIIDNADALLLRANREIVLQCGDASIILTRAGKIILRGAYVLSRATGVNSIQGGSVQIN